MKVQAKSSNTDWMTESLRRIGYTEQSKLDITPLRVYEVHAVALWSGNAFYQIVGDSDIITWMPSSHFTVVDRSIPSDWLANCIDEEVPFIVGPDFLVRDKEAYVDMVELATEQVTQFMRRLLRRAHTTLDSPSNNPRE